MSTKAWAWTILFILAVNEVQHGCDAHRMGMVAVQAAAADEANKARADYAHTWGVVKDTLAINTEWSTYGSDQPWKKAEITFKLKASEEAPDGPKYMYVYGMGGAVLIMPDAVIGMKTLKKGMPVLQITGYQRWEVDKKTKRKSWSTAKYRKDEALLIRVEKNPVIGATKMIILSTPAGLKVYENPETKERYHLTEKGKLDSIMRMHVEEAACQKGDAVKFSDGTGDCTSGTCDDAKVVNIGAEDIITVAWLDHDAKEIQISRPHVKKGRSTCAEVPCVVGDRVEALYRPNNHYYSAVIESIEKKDPPSMIVDSSSWNQRANLQPKSQNRVYKEYKGALRTCESLHPTSEPFLVHTSSVQPDGQESVTEITLKEPDRELMSLLDLFLSRTTCMNGNKCLYRCMYDSETDMCGPSALCKKTEEIMDGNSLAPFGPHQKCMAVGSDIDHATADSTLAAAGVERIQDQAFAVVTDLDEAEAAIENKQSALKVRKLWSAASEILRVMETLTWRIKATNDEATKAGEDEVVFPALSARLEQKDAGHWNAVKKGSSLLQVYKADELWIKAYAEAAAAPAPKTTAEKELFKTDGLSVAAKVHSSLVKFLVKRPIMLTQMMKLQSDNTCELGSKSGEEADLETFVNFYLRTPGYKADSNDGNLDDSKLSTGCKDLLKARADSTVQTKNLESRLSGSDEPKRAGHRSKTAKVVGGTASEGAPSALVEEIEMEDGSSTLNATLNVGNDDYGLNDDYLESGDFGFTILCIIVCIVCALLAGALFVGAGVAASGNARDGMKTYMACAILGVMVLAGAFACATGVGVIALIVALVIGVVGTVVVKMKGSHIQLHAQELAIGAPKSSDQGYGDKHNGRIEEAEIGLQGRGGLVSDILSEPAKGTANPLGALVSVVTSMG